MTTEVRHDLDRERRHLLRRIERWSEGPLLMLSFVWVALFVVELTVGLSPFLQDLGTVIWALFIADFALKLVIAPNTLEFLRRNWLTLIALLLPALRVVRFAWLVHALRTAGGAQGIELARVLARTNRGMAALERTFRHRGFGFALSLTGLVTVVGAAGMLAFEHSPPHQAGLHGYGGAVWWTAMLMTTMGSDYWPQTGPGRLLCLILAVYAFSIFGYITATLASFFVGRDADDEKKQRAAAALRTARSIEALRAEVAALRAELQRLAPTAVASGVRSPEPGDVAAPSGRHP